MGRKVKVSVEQYLRVGQAARMCGVTNATMSKWVDSDQIAGSYRVPRTSKSGQNMKGVGLGLSSVGGDRRIHRDGLIAFMKKHKIGIQAMRQPLLYTLGLTATTAKMLESELPHAKISSTDCPITLTTLVVTAAPAAIVVSSSIPRSIVMAMPKNVAAIAAMQHLAPKMAALVPDDGSFEGMAMTQVGYELVVNESEIGYLIEELRPLFVAE